MSVLSMIEKRATQTMVYWGSPTNDGYGKYTFDAPVEIMVRWEDEVENFAKDSRSRMQIDKDGREYRPNAKITTVEIPDEGWSLDGYVFLGTITDLAGETDPYVIRGAYEIKQIDFATRLTDSTAKMFMIYI